MAEHFLQRRLAEFQGRIEREAIEFKGQLDREADLLRHDLQREMIKASLITSVTARGTPC